MYALTTRYRRFNSSSKFHVAPRY